MKTVKLTNEHVGRKLSFWGDSRSNEGTIVKVDADGGFSVHVPGESTWTMSPREVFEMESVEDSDYPFDRVVLLPLEKEKRAMEIRGFLNFLAEAGICLAHRPEEDFPLAAVTPAKSRALLKNYLNEK